MIRKKTLPFEEILSGCIKNKNNCKEMLYKLFYGYLIAIILRYTKNEADSEELVNDSFIKIFKNLSGFRRPSDPTALEKTFKGWIAQIASRTAIDKIRGKKLINYVDDLSEIDHPVTEISVEADLYVQDILRLLDALPDTHRLVFNLYEIDGFKHDEISKMLKIPESSSRVYLTRAKNKLRSLYLNTMPYSLRENG